MMVTNMGVVVGRRVEKVLVVLVQILRLLGLLLLLLLDTVLMVILQRVAIEQSAQGLVSHRVRHSSVLTSRESS